MKIPKKKIAKTSNDIDEFIEWLLEEAEERGIALAGWSGLKTKEDHGENQIDFTPFRTSLSLNNIEKIEEKATSRYKEEVINTIMEEIRSQIDIYLKSPIAVALDM